MKYLRLALSVVLIASAAASASANTIKIRLFTAPEWCIPCRQQEAVLPSATPMLVPFPAGQTARCVRVEFDVRSLNIHDAAGNETQNDEINGAVLDSSVGPSRACSGDGGRSIPCNQLMFGDRLIEERGPFRDVASFNAWVAEQLRLSRVDVRSQLQRCSAP